MNSIFSTIILFFCFPFFVIIVMPYIIIECIIKSIIIVLPEGKIRNDYVNNKKN